MNMELKESIDRMEFELNITKELFHVGFPKPVRMMSSAILNGGGQWANHFINCRVDANFNGEKTDFEPPVVTVERIAESNGWSGFCVGMMTAANMDSFRRVRREAQGVWIEVFLTAGVSNARRAGDMADYRYIDEVCAKTGTINMLILTNAFLSDAALVECIMMATEAKAAALQDLKVKSPVSGLLATGTGTDSTAVVCGEGPEVIYCGKHVLFGELLAQAVHRALTDSLLSQ
ncbi:MAG: adenosylcobinamide amidohydrolase [Marinifilaceae bacterium]